MKRQEIKNHRLLWGGLLILFGGMFFMELYVNIAPWLWTVVIGGSSMLIFRAYARKSRLSVLMIPIFVVASSFLFVMLLTLDLLPREWGLIFILTIIALSFLAVYFQNRHHWWALIPAYVLICVVGLIFFEGWLLVEELIAPYIMFTSGLPFFVVYFYDTSNWWALIPGGIMVGIGLIVLMSSTLASLILPLILVGSGLWLLLWRWVKPRATIDFTPQEKITIISDAPFDFDIESLKKSEKKGLGTTGKG